MSPLIDVTQFRERFDVDKNINDPRIEPHIGSASRRLRQWVGDTLYNQAVAVASNETTDAELVADLKNAEAHLTMHFAIYGFNSPLSMKGVVATSMAGEGKEMRKYLTPDETAKLSAYYLELAREIASPYIPETIDAGIEISPASDEYEMDLSMEAVTRA